MKYIVYRKYFQAHRKSIFIGSVRDFMGSIDE